MVVPYLRRPASRCRCWATAGHFEGTELHGTPARRDIPRGPSNQTFVAVPKLKKKHISSTTTSTNSFTIAELVQQEAIAREGPLYSEAFFHLLRTVMQGEALMQFAQRLRDTADEEVVTPLGNFVAAACREPDLAEELDRADEAAQAEADEEIPSPSQQRQLLRAQATGELCRALRNGRCRRGVVRWVKRNFKCPECEARPMPKTRPAAALPKCYRIKFVASTLCKFGIR